jgi:hypothetical protein
VHLRHERTGRIEHVETALFRIPFDTLRDAVRAENGNRALRHFIELFDKASALSAQVIDHMPVVDDFVAHVHGCAVLLQRTVDDFDRAYNARTKAAGLSKDDSHKLANSD